MPNTLCHIAVQGPFSSLIGRPQLLFWGVIGCIIPDLPWVSLSLLLKTGFFDPYDLRLYTTIQASLLFCLLLSVAISQFARKPMEVTLLLSLNVLLHLLLDALQIKWGNGANLLAPFDWTMFHLDLLWPEALLVTLLTIAGFGWLLANWQSMRNNPPPLRFPQAAGRWIALLFLLAYILFPLLLLASAEEADLYSLHTLRAIDQRPGKPMSFDRAHYFADSQSLKTFAGEKITVTGMTPATSGRVSFKGYFTGPTSYHAIEFHYHHDQRDFASLVGLIMACTLVFQSVILPIIKRYSLAWGFSI